MNKSGCGIMSESNVEETSIIQKMIEFNDPLSVTKEQRINAFSFEEFYLADEAKLAHAFQNFEGEVSKKSNDFFDFLTNVSHQHKLFTSSDLVWGYVGIPNEAILVNIEFDKSRKASGLSATTVRREEMVQQLSIDPNNQWCMRYFKILNSISEPGVYVLYTDDERSKIHGFPFDIGLWLSIPDYKEDTDVVKIFINGLHNGVTTLDSSYLFKMKESKLDSALITIIKSQRFSKKQIDYVYSITLVKKPLDLLISKNQFEYYTENEQKRYTEVFLKNASPTNLQYRMRSEKRTSPISFDITLPSDRLEELARLAMENLEDGDHLIRFFNIDYYENYSELMWVPIIIRNGEIDTP
jgi:hypothetical protein